MNYWWLNINPKVLRFRELDTGSFFSYSALNEDGTKRRIYMNFEEAQVGDYVIAYEGETAKEIIGICVIAKALEKNNLILKKVENLVETVLRYDMEQNRDIANIEAFRNAHGTFFRLTKNEFEIIYNMIRECNPLKQYYVYETYTKEDFLKEVYFNERDYEELKTLILKEKNVILQGAPGVGKTYIARRMAYTILGKKDEDRILTIQFHEGYSTEEFLEGFRPDGIGIYKYRKGCFKSFCNRARNDRKNPYFLIIDEINRGNITKIFGETFMLIEADKRGKENYIELACSKERFYVPENVYLIGTMNMADRGLAIGDYALRRRFSFYTVKPIFDNPKFKMVYQSNPKLNHLVEKVVKINEGLEEGRKIGHCYFCDNTITDEDINITVKYHLIPLMYEYFWDNEPKAKEIAQELESAITDPMEPKEFK